MIARPLRVRLAVAAALIGLTSLPIPAQRSEERRQGTEDPEAATRIVELQNLEPGPEALAAYRAALGDARPAVRATAVQLLCAARAEGDVARLLPLLEDTDENVALAAVLCLVEADETEVVPRVAKALGRMPDVAQAQVVSAIGDRGDARYLDAVGATLSASNPGVRGTAIEALRAIGDRRAVKFCMAATGDSNADIVRSAIGCLEVLRDPATVPRLVQLADSPNEELRGAVGHALPGFAAGSDTSAEVGKVRFATIEKLLKDASRNVVLSTLGGMERNPAPEWTRMVAPMVGDADRRVRRVAVKVLSRTQTDDARNALAKALKDPEEFIRASAVQGLAESRSDKTVPLIQPLADDPSANVRAAVASGLGESGTSAVLPTLARLAADQDPLVRASSMTGAGAIGGSRSLEILEKGSHDSESIVRVSCVRALAASGGDRARAILRRLAGETEKDITVRVSAITELGRLGDRESIPMLRQAGRHDAEAIRTAARAALAAIGA